MAKPDWLVADRKGARTLSDRHNELVAAANTDPNFGRVSRRMYFAIQGLAVALGLRSDEMPSEDLDVGGPYGAHPYVVDGVPFEIER